MQHAATPPTPRYIKWSEHDVCWTRKDHPAKIPSPGRYALIVNPLIEGYEFTKVLMDGGSSINILYIETLKKMHLTVSQLKHSDTTFHGVVQGRQALSLGSITLDASAMRITTA